MLSHLINMSRNEKRALQVVVDAALLPVAFFIAMWLRLDRVDFLTNPSVWLAMVLVLPLSVLLFA